MNSRQDGPLLIVEIRNAVNEDNLSIATQMRSLIEEKKPHGVVIDIRLNIQRPDPTILYDRFYNQKYHVHMPHGIPFALVLPEDSESLGPFYEDIAANTGRSARCFRQLEPACAWLRELIEGERQQKEI